MNQLTARERRLVALAILVALVSALWFLAVQPLAAGFSNRAEARRRLTQELDRNARLIDSAPSIRLQAAQVDREALAFAFPTTAPGQAVESARARLAADVETEGGALRALRLQPAPPQRVRLQADLQMSWIGLTRMLRRLETDRPFATVDALEITSGGASASSPSAAPLEIRLELTYAYR